jgi:chemotaxis protein histidine kinase CheA
MNDAAADDEIVEIFIEEAGEVLEAMDGNLATWKRSPGDKQALTEIRRGFHTLKGSGRMVKALDLAEMAWKVENMLNRAIEGTVSVSEPMVRLVDSVRGLMPRMVDAFKGQTSVAGDRDVELLMAQADAIAHGQALPTSAAPPTPAPAVAAAAGAGDQDMRFKIADLNRKLERVMQRADEALLRSEMALQQARRVTSQIKALDSEAQDRVGKAEMTRVGERVNFLTKELLELRLAAKRVQQEAAPPHPRELNQLIDHRVREKVAPLERLRSELEHELAANRRAAAASKQLAVVALVLSLLVGGAMAAGVVMTLL